MNQTESDQSTIPPFITSVVMTDVRTIALQRSATRPLEDGEYFIKTLYSGVSAGTELTFYLGTNPKSAEGWDQERRLFRSDMEPADNDSYPKNEGDTEVGVVLASRNQDFPVGTQVAGKYRHRDGYIADASDYIIALPDDFDPLLGIWVAKIGPISLNGILYAADDLRRRPVESIKSSLADQRVVVMGAGTIGLLCGLFAQWAGAKEVIIIDGISERLSAAESLGLVPMMADPSLPIIIKDRWQADDSSDSGADMVLQCTGSDYLLNQAFRCLREQGTVVDLGFYQQAAGQVFLGHEFHHNRLRHVCAQIGAIPRGQTGLWDHQRLSRETITFLQEHGQKLKKHLITNIVPFSQAQTIYERLAARDNSVLQVVLQPETAQ